MLKQGGQYRSILWAFAAPRWRRSPRCAAISATPSPAATRTSIRRCPRSSKRAASASWRAISESNLDHRPDLVVIGNAMKRGNPEIERAARRTLELLLAAGAGARPFHPRQTLDRRRRHARQDDHDLAAGVGAGIGRAAARVSSSAASRTISATAARASAPGPLLRHRRRRVRHGVLRQTQQVRPLPARHGHPEQHRVRSRRHLSGSRRGQARVPATRRHRPAPRADHRQRRRRQRARGGRRRAVPRAVLHARRMPTGSRCRWRASTTSATPRRSPCAPANWACRASKSSTGSPRSPA